MTLKCEKKKGRNQQCLKLHTGNVVSGYIEKLKPLREFRSVLLDRKNYTWKNNRASLVAQMVKNPPAMQKTWVGNIPWRRAWQPTPLFLPGESHGQGTLVGYSPGGLQRVRYN